ncbi:hypothetical protein [Nitrosopumilus sp.]|uniref:hypothetical protein n=1 Tax=Nitrosopumilus sp. TaxID=2024843 RepID=UPI00247D4C91|nr:hypothetical protein [Nitrosopumilus sp.]MCV0431832.1 hypothetical protein [Nitrosopumilus sp.]
MKKIFLVVTLFFVITPAYGQALSDATGLVNRLDVQTGGHSFEIQVVSNFDISDFEFDKGDKKLTLYITSGLENNLGEVLIPKNLLSGNFTFYLNDQEYVPEIKSNQKVFFITLNFTGSGENELEILGTTYLSGLSEKPQPAITSPDLEPVVEYDYELIYATVVILFIIGGIIGVIAFAIKRRK